MDVFSEDKLNKIFKCYEDQDSNKIISRESTTLEFKASFSTSAIPRYAKTMAAFANRDGGYIIFGVKNNPRIVIGLKDNTFDKSKLKTEINKITADSKNGKKYLLERLKSDENFVPEKLTGKDLELKMKYLNLFNNTETKLEDIPDENIDIQLRMILNIVNKERIKNLIIPLLKVYLDKYYETQKSLLRKAISYADKLLYADKLINF